ncbi:hypothetical protein [Fastidiosibacter lacustris]|uniref:hypothetical protein n=1 Tax=Fastidiosibacter lacustris TaxID=2056695 RepID=UPI00130075FC|nr:hypothetical protein [Fastidiosibacter lacustris]
MNYYSAIKYDLEAIMYQVGKALTNIQKITFQVSGFFDQQLKIIASTADNECIKLARRALEHKTAKIVLSEELISRITQLLYKYDNLIQKINGVQLVHGDFGPENILVNNVSSI